MLTKYFSEISFTTCKTVFLIDFGFNLSRITIGLNIIGKDDLEFRLLFLSICVYWKKYKTKAKAKEWCNYYNRKNDKRV